MISHKHKFIFVHINKTGGTSIRKALFPDSPRENIHRVIRYYKKLYPKQFDEYFKFTFVRNPWDKVVSQYEFRKPPDRFPLGHTTGMSFEQFVKSPVGRPLQNQLDWITIKGKVMIDWIGYFETLQRDFDAVCKQLHIDQRTLPVYNKTEHKHYSTYYNSKTRKRVAEIFSKDIEYFGYQFEEI